MEPVFGGGEPHNSSSNVASFQTVKVVNREHWKVQKNRKSRITHFHPMKLRLRQVTYFGQ